MPGHHVIPLLSTVWYWGIALSALYVGGILYARRFLGTATQKQIPQLLGTILLCTFFAAQAYYWFVSDISSKDNALPLQLCDISQLICVYALLRKNQLAFEFALLLGMPAAMHSIATPEMTHGYGAYLLFDYYFSHSTQILAPLLLLFYCGMRPGVHSWWRVFLVVNAIIVVVFAIDLLIDANYIYLMEKPSVDNPLLIGPWPWYIIGVELAGLIHILLFYLIFRKAKVFTGEPVAATSTE